MKASNIMKKEVVTAKPSDSISDVTQLFLEHDISGMPVMKGSELVGMITEADIIRYIESKSRGYKMVLPSLPMLGVSFEEVCTDKEIQEIFRDVGKTKVSEVMQKDVLTAGPDNRLKEIATLMTDRNINRVPIVDGGELVGIITRGDILKALTKV